MTIRLPPLFRWARRRRPTRAALIDRKHELEGRMRQLSAEIDRLRARNAPTAHAESRLAQLRNRHYRIRQDIDRADP